MLLLNSFRIKTEPVLKFFQKKVKLNLEISFLTLTFAAILELLIN